MLDKEFKSGVNSELQEVSYVGRKIGLRVLLLTKDLLR